MASRFAAETNRQADKDTEFLSKKSESLKYELASLKERLRQLESIANAAAKTQGKAGGAAVPSQVAERTTLLASKIDSSKRKLMTKLTQLAACVNSVKRAHAQLSALGAERCHADAAYLSLAREERRLGERVSTLTKRHAQLARVQAALAERTDSLARLRDDIYSEAATIQAYVQDAMHDPQKLLDVLPAVHGDESTDAGAADDDDDALARAARGDGARNLLQRTGWSNQPSQAWGGILSGVAKAKAVARKTNTHEMTNSSVAGASGSGSGGAAVQSPHAPPPAGSPLQPPSKAASVRSSATSGTKRRAIDSTPPVMDERAAVGVILQQVSQGELNSENMPQEVQLWLGSGTDAAEAMRCALLQLAARWSASSRRRFLAAEAYEALLGVQDILVKSHVVHRILKDAAARHATLAAKPTLRALSSSKPLPPSQPKQFPPRPQSAAGRAASAVALLHGGGASRRPSTAMSTASRVTFAEDSEVDEQQQQQQQRVSRAGDTWGEAFDDTAVTGGHASDHKYEQEHEHGDDGDSDSQGGYSQDSYEDAASPSHDRRAEQVGGGHDAAETSIGQPTGDHLALASMQVAVPDVHRDLLGGAGGSSEVAVWDGASIELATDQMERQAAQTISLQQQRQLLLQFQTVLIRMLRKLQGSSNDGDGVLLEDEGGVPSPDGGGRGDRQGDNDHDVVRALVDEQDGGAGGMSQQRRAQHRAGMRAGGGAGAADPPLHLLLDQLAEAQSSTKAAHEPPRLIHGRGAHTEQQYTPPPGLGGGADDPYGDGDWEEGGHEPPDAMLLRSHSRNHTGHSAPAAGRMVIRDVKGTPLINVSSRMSAHERAQMAQLDSTITRLHLYLQGLQRKEGMLQQVTEKVRKNASFATVFSVLAGLYGHEDPVLQAMQEQTSASASTGRRMHSSSGSQRPATAASMVAAAGRPVSQQSSAAHHGHTSHLLFAAKPPQEQVHRPIKVTTPTARAARTQENKQDSKHDTDAASDSSYSDDYDSADSPPSRKDATPPRVDAGPDEPSAPGIMQSIAGGLSIPFPWSAATLSLYLTEVELTARELGSAPDALREAGLL